ncbi:MAG: M20/M25/M40 family metallo-hydrolase, partial [Proteobacteria bacterium]|nr:M20/M25/M40 family metallo-hydrolase [Pseudomonadota bacterium]
VVRWLAAWLRARGYTVEMQPVEGERANLYVTLGDPVVVLSTHLDCVPPFFPSRQEDGLLYGRGACDAKGIAAAQVGALEQLRAAGETRVGLLFVVGEERGSHGAHAANQVPPGSRYLVNGEPTDNRLGAATRGVYRVKLLARGRAAHSSHPEQGESAIEKLVDALVALRTLDLPRSPTLGATTYTVSLIDGGIAPNVVPPHASAEVNFRIVGAASAVRAALASDPALLNTVLAGGDDYELVFTAAPDAATALSELAAEIDVAIAAIGRIIAGSGVRVLDEHGAALDLPESGYRHM